MKKDIHPEYYDVVATCHCGASHKVGSTLQNIHLDICSACHPVFSGEGGFKILDSEGLVNKFKKRYENTARLQEEMKKRQEHREAVTKEEAERKNRKKERSISKLKS